VEGGGGGEGGEIILGGSGCGRVGGGGGGGGGSPDTLQLTMVWYRPRVSGYQRHTPTLKFIEYPLRDSLHKI